MAVIGLDIATSTGMVILADDGEPLWSFQGSWLRLYSEVPKLERPPGPIHIAYEMPFVGDNKRAAVYHAFKVGAITDWVCAWAGTPISESHDWQPKEWRRAIGCPMDRVSAKAWCVERAYVAGIPCHGPRGGALDDMAEAWGIAEAERRLRERDPTRQSR